MAAIEPTIISLLTESNVINTPNGQAAIAAYDAALTAIQNWQSGTTAQNVLQLIADFQKVFNTLPIPTKYVTLVNIILAGVEAVIAVIAANSPAPDPPAGVVVHADTQAMHQAATAADAQAKIQKLVPGFKRSIFHSPESQYKGAWDKAVDAGGFPATLKV
jgi:hypothetical protein